MSAPPDPGSFRDPLSRVYVDGDAVWRGLSEAGLADFEAYAATEAYRAAQADGRLVATTAVPVAEAPIDASWAGALRHERLRVLTYPYEWAFSMLRDAARLQLELSRAALAEGEQRILPLVLDLADPSPAMGWRSKERPSFVDRVRPDLVLCLAVIHHLALSNTVPFDEIVEFLHDFGATLVVEMPHRDDPMASRLLGRKRSGVFDHYDQPQWEAALGRRFTVLEQTTLPSGTRTLYLCRPV